MIKKLRIKFVCVIMAILMVMLFAILSTVVYFTASSMEQQAIGTMRIALSKPLQHIDPKKPDRTVRLPCFTAQTNKQGNVLDVAGDYFDLTDREDIQEIVDAALLRDGETGILDDFDLRYLKSHSPRGYTIVFADTTAEISTLRQLLISCSVIFCGSSLVFFGVSVLLSRWVIKPVEEAWNQQRQFVADASHELKTPLSVIMTSAELLSSGPVNETEQAKYSGNILNMTYQMRNLVDTMLEMARVDNGTNMMQMKYLDFSQLVEDSVVSFQLLYEEKGMNLVSGIQSGVNLPGSEQHLYQVMDVLLDNALKYSEADSTVRVNLTQSGRFCTLSVSSSGKALSKEELKNIFKRFYRADKAREMNGSYGLGLSIAQSIVQAHKGKIWAESSGGTNTFYVQLPLQSGRGS